MFFSDKSSDNDVVVAVVKPANSQKDLVANQNNSNKTTKVADHDVDKLEPVTTTRNLSSKNNKVERIVPILALYSRQSLISVGHIGLDGKKLDVSSPIFTTQSWIPVPPVDPKLKNPPPPPPPMAPPLNFTFIGKKLEAGVWEIYLARGNNSYIVRKESVIDGTYRVDSVTPTALILTYLPLNQVQRLNIKGFD